MCLLHDAPDTLSPLLHRAEKWTCSSSALFFLAREGLGNASAGLVVGRAAAGPAQHAQLSSLCCHHAAPGAGTAADGCSGLSVMPRAPSLPHRVGGSTATQLLDIPVRAKLPWVHSRVGVQCACAARAQRGVTLTAVEVSGRKMDWLHP